MKQLNWYQIFGKSNIPDGRTVEPTDDIQIWLHCANIWNKSYTTLAEVLADADTLLALITSNNAVDYMVRSTSWAVPITVPVMTSNTTPSGVVSSNNEGQPAYYAFDNNSGTYWSAHTADDVYLQYQFNESIVLAKWAYQGTSSYLPSKIKLQGSNDGISFTEIDSVVTPSSDTDVHERNVSTTTAYLYYRMICSARYTSAYGYYSQLTSAQFYSASVTTSADAMTYIGQNNYAANTLLADATWREAICNSEYFESVLNVKVPTMTSYTAPSGECISSGDFSSDYAWKAFDGNDNTMYSSSGTGTGGGLWLGYTFPSATKVYLAKAVHRVNTDQTTTVSFKYQSKTANGEWKNISDDFSVVFHGDKPTTSVIVAGGDEDVSYRIYRNNATVGTRLVMWTLQFYGREDV